MAEPRSLDIGVYGIRGIPSTYSGYETFASVLLPELVRRGHRVTAYCRGRRQHDSFEGVRCVYLPSVRTKQLDTLSHGAVATIAGRLHRHDVLLVMNVSNALFTWLPRYTGQPVALNVDGQEWLRGKWGKTARRLFYRSARISKRTANLLITDCDAMQDHYRQEFDAESVVIPYCWTNLVGPEDEADASAVLDELGLEPYQYFVSGGRLIPENNIHLIAEAYHQSSRREPLAIVGKANYESIVAQRVLELEKIDSRIRVLGHVADRRAFGLLLRFARGYIHGHSVGGMNPQLVEAMGSGALVFALGTAFDREVLGEAGFYFDDPADLPALLGTALRGDGLQQSVRAAAETRALREYSLKRAADGYESELRRLVAG